MQYKAAKSLMANISLLALTILLLIFVLPGAYLLPYHETWGIALIACGIVFSFWYLIKRAIKTKHETITFYEDRYVTKSGFLTTREKSVAFKGVKSVTVYQKLRGKIFNYGTVRIDVGAKREFTIVGVRNPQLLKKYLETRTINVDQVNQTIVD